MNHGSASQFKTIVTLFVILRLTILFLYTPQGLLNAYTDYQHYYRTAQLSDQGYYPFVNMWYEYPPLFTYVAEGAYRLTQSLVPTGDLQSFGYQVYARWLGGVLLIFETGVLILIHRIAVRAWGVQKADWLGWIYSGLSWPLFIWQISLDTMAVFFTLLSLDWLMAGRPTRSAVALGLGIATKFMPFFLIAPAVKFLLTDWRKSVKYVVVTLLSTTTIFVPFFLLGGGPWVVASFVALSKIGSWSTPWALLDGNWGVGNAGPLSARLQIGLASHPPGNPPVVPWIVTIVICAVVYGLIFRRPIERRDPRALIWFSTLTLIIFLLWSKGWGPQWVVHVFPFLLLAFPDERGLRLTLLLTAIVFVEWPLADALGSRVLLTVSILGRVTLFVVVAVALDRLLKRTPAAATSQTAPPVDSRSP